MCTKSLATRSALVIALMSGIGLSYTARSQETKEVTVEASRAVGRSGTTNAPVHEVTTQRRVTFSDISLSTASGAAALENRIRDAAKAACDELDKKYPLTAAPATEPSCYTAAVDKAMIDARKAIAAANRTDAKSGASTYTAASPKPQEITVEASRGRSGTTGAPVKTVTAERRVTFADINLATDSGAAVFQARIRDAAKSACDELDKKYPLDAGGENKCYKTAVDSAMVDAQHAIGAARRTLEK